MVEIAREVLKQTDKIRFELAGEGPDMERIIGLVHEFKIEKYFSLKGFVEDMSSFYQGIDLYINTSFHEGFPMSVLEAMAHGIPVIALNTGGLKEIINDGIQGYLIEGRDPNYQQKNASNFLKIRK
jgi:glycosyltransferase involved in cell wall biosynthesis